MITIDIEQIIPYKLAYDAFRNSSFVPEKRVKDRQESIKHELTALVEEFTAWRTDDNAAEMQADLEQYVARYAEKYQAWLAAKSRTASVMITGASNFPTQRNQKRLDTEQRRMEEFLEWTNKAEHRLRKKYNPALANTDIRSDDGDAITKLEEKLAKLEAAQEMMKAINRIARSKKLTDDQKIEKMAEFDAISREAAAELLVVGSLRNKPGFPSYQLTNNNANIRRTKQRIKDLRREEERETAEDYEATILGEPVTVHEDDALVRLQLFFEGKPPADVRDLLKRNGFKWARSIGAWQRLLNTNARGALKYYILDK